MTSKYERTWVAALYDQDGYVVDRDEFVEEFEYGGNEYLDSLSHISLAKGSARPSEESDGIYAGPGMYRSLDLVSRRDVSVYDFEEILEILDEFNEIADLLNSAGTEKGEQE